MTVIKVDHKTFLEFIQETQGILQDAYEQIESLKQAKKESELRAEEFAKSSLENLRFASDMEQENQHLRAEIERLHDSKEVREFAGETLQVPLFPDHFEHSFFANGGRDASDEEINAKLREMMDAGLGEGESDTEIVEDTLILRTREEGTNEVVTYIAPGFYIHAGIMADTTVQAEPALAGLFPLHFHSNT